MKLIGCMPVKNEDWILGLSARVALSWCDELLILLNDCTDRSLGITAELADEYERRLDFAMVPGWWDEMQHRQKLIDHARRRGASHIALIDADEILTGNLAPSKVRFWIESMSEGTMFTLPLYNLRGGMYRYHSNGLWGGGAIGLAFKDEPRLHWKGDRFHHRQPMGRAHWNHFQPLERGEGGVMHLWGVSEPRLLAKHALYKVTERLRWPEKDVAQIDRYYSMCVNGEKDGEPAGWTFDTAPASWWTPYAHWLKYLNFEDTEHEPWQAIEVRRLVAEHGRAQFAGLDLFGVDR